MKRFFAFVVVLVCVLFGLCDAQEVAPASPAAAAPAVKAPAKAAPAAPAAKEADKASAGKEAEVPKIKINGTEAFFKIAKECTYMFGICAVLFVVMHFVKMVSPFYVATELVAELGLLVYIAVVCVIYTATYESPMDSSWYLFYGLVTTAGVTKGLYVMFVVPFLP